MLFKIKRRLVLACMAGASLFAVDADAAATLLQPSTDHCHSQEMQALNEPARDLSADEQRVVLWLVHRILSVDEDDGSAQLEFTAATVSAALAIDVRCLDRERIQDQVRAMLVGHSCQRALEQLD